MEVKDGNKLIIESPFASELHKRLLAKIKKYEPNDSRFWEIFKPHEKWEILMPVVEKIEALKDVSIYYGFGVTIRPNSCAIECYEAGRQHGTIYQTPYGFTPDSKIHATWLAIVDFIQWHNTQSPAKAGE